VLTLILTLISLVHGVSAVLGKSVSSASAVDGRRVGKPNTKCAVIREEQLMHLTIFFLYLILLINFHRIIESWNGLDWKGPYISSSSNPPAMGRDPFHQTRLLKTPSNLALNTAREGAATASLGNLGQGLTTLVVKNFFLRSNRNLLSFNVKPLCFVLVLHGLVKSPSPAFL